MARFTKKFAKELALEVRAELGVAPMEALDPYALADLYGVGVTAIGDLTEVPDAIEHFTHVRPAALSAALLPFGSGALIIENDIHDPRRRVSNMAHEMAHVLLEHPFSLSLLNESGCRIGADLEKQATETSGELLIPYSAAHKLARRNVSNEEVALRFGVSIPFAAWRMNATGARIVARRIHAQTY